MEGCWCFPLGDTSPSPQLSAVRLGGESEAVRSYTCAGPTGLPGRRDARPAHAHAWRRQSPVVRRPNMPDASVQAEVCKPGDLEARGRAQSQ